MKGFASTECKSFITHDTKPLTKYVKFSKLSYSFRFHSKYICIYIYIKNIGLVWFGLVSLFYGISTFVGYLMPKPSF